MINLDKNFTDRISTGNASVQSWIKLAPNIILVVSGSPQFSEPEHPVTSSYAQTASVALIAKNVPTTYPTISAPTGGNATLVKSGNYPITASWSRCSITSSYVSGSISLDGTQGHFAMFGSGSLLKESSIHDGGDYIFSSKPIFSPNSLKTVVKSQSPLSINELAYIPVVIDGVIYKLALLR